MNVIFVLILASLVVAVGFLVAFLWAVKDGQFEDDYTPAVRILFDDPKPAGNTKKGGDSSEENTQKTS